MLTFIINNEYDVTCIYVYRKRKNKVILCKTLNIKDPVSYSRKLLRIIHDGFSLDFYDTIKCHGGCDT